MTDKVMVHKKTGQIGEKFYCKWWPCYCITTSMILPDDKGLVSDLVRAGTFFFDDMTEFNDFEEVCDL